MGELIGQGVCKLKRLTARSGPLHEKRIPVPGDHHGFDCGDGSRSCERCTSC